MDEISDTSYKRVVELLLFEGEVLLQRFEDLAILDEVDDYQRTFLAEETGEDFLVDLEHLATRHTAEEYV